MNEAGTTMKNVCTGEGSTVTCEYLRELNPDRTFEEQKELPY